MKTTKTTRYQKTIEQKKTTRSKIIQAAQITPQEYYNIEFETGCALVESYFEGMDPGIVYHLKNMLLKMRKHNYWLWFINQKQQYEFAFHNEYTAATGHNYDSAHYLEEYTYAMLEFTQSTKIHDRLRHFIIQSKTISA